MKICYFYQKQFKFLFIKMFKIPLYTLYHILYQVYIGF
nr:MAG TPA: hypothetical protein [Caudoviricetes sp.]